MNICTGSEWQAGPSALRDACLLVYGASSTQMGGQPRSNVQADATSDLGSGLGGSSSPVLSLRIH